MAHIGNIPVNLDDGIWRARASNPDGYVRHARFCSLQIENEDSEALITLYFARAKLERVHQLATLLNEIAGPAHDVPAAGSAVIMPPVAAEPAPSSTGDAIVDWYRRAVR